jgi:hypothetical protein
MPEQLPLLEADRSRKRRADARAAGRCTRCLRVEVEKGAMCCDDCRWKTLERHRQRARRALREGTCTQCLRGKPAEGRLQCVACLSAKRSHHRPMPQMARGSR